LVAVERLDPHRGGPEELNLVAAGVFMLVGSGLAADQAEVFVDPAGFAGSVPNTGGLLRVEFHVERVTLFFGVVAGRALRHRSA